MSHRVNHPNKGIIKANKSKTDKKTDKKETECQNQNGNQSDPDISISIPGETLEEIRKEFEKQLNLVKVDCTAQVNALHRVINDNYSVIGNLQRDIGELKKTCDFLTEETHVLRGQIKKNETSLEANAEKYNTLTDKTTDLEDRSRRSNLVFFNIPEPADGVQNENCEEKVKNLLHEMQLFAEYDIPIDRAHRLGKKPVGPGSKPRPVIAKFTYYKDKEHIIKNGRKFKNSTVNCSEDYSKNTLEIHKKIWQHAKAAKETLSCEEGQIKTIKYFKVTYRRVMLTYTTNKNNPEAPVFVKSFSLKHIQENSKWYLPPQRNTYTHVMPN